MKKISKIFIYYFIIPASSFSFLSAQNTPCQDVTNPLWRVYSNEPPINFGKPTDKNSNYYYDTSDFIKGRKAFDSVYKYQSNVNEKPRPFANSQEFVKIKGIDSIITVLDNWIKANQNEFLGTNYYALKMYYGISGQDMILWFEPVVLKSQTNTKRKEVAQTCEIFCSKRYFKFDINGEVVLFNDPKNPIEKVFGQDTTAYQSEKSNIYIAHGGKNYLNEHKFISQKNDITFKNNDVRSVIMPLQQIIKMYFDNGGECLQKDEKITFSFVADGFYNYELRRLHKNYVLQPHIVSSYQLGTKIKQVAATGDFTGYGADYTEHCPTSCSLIDINSKNPNYNKLKNIPTNQ